jgi:hypothetical protein
MVAHRLPLAALTVALAPVLFVLACNDDKKTSDSAKADASATRDKNATLDPKLEQALAAAASASASSASGDGPPQTGVFAAADADKRHPRGAPMKVEMGSEGSAPRVSLAPDADAASSPAGAARLTVGMRTGRVALPTIDFAVVYGGPKPDAKDAKKDDKTAAPPPPTPDTLVVALKKVTPAADQRGSLPPGSDKEIGALAGSEIRFRCPPDGRTGELSLLMPKSASPDLELLATNAGEAMLLAIVPVPPKPVGVGGYWLAESRMPWFGVDVIAYRAYRVKSIEGDKVTITFDVRQYATEREPKLAGLPRGATLDQYEAVGQGELELVRGDIVARAATISHRVTMVLQGEGAGAQQPPGQPGQPQRGMIQAQIEMDSKLARDLGKAK